MKQLRLFDLFGFNLLAKIAAEQAERRVVNYHWNGEKW